MSVADVLLVNNNNDFARSGSSANLPLHSAFDNERDRKQVDTRLSTNDKVNINVAEA